MTVFPDPIVKINEPNAPWAEKIKLGPGESIQFGDIPTHSGTARAYAWCTESGENCAEILVLRRNGNGRWSFRTQNNIGINLTLGRSGLDSARHTTNGNAVDLRHRWSNDVWSGQAARQFNPRFCRISFEQYALQRA
jgi:hypothetical protein